MRTVLIPVGLLLLPLGPALAQGTAPATSATGGAAHAAHVVRGDAITWGAAPAALPAGATVAVMDGDPTKAGPYTMRLRMPDGYQIPPHFHPVAEHVTVLSGQFVVGMGDRVDESQMQTLPPGTFAALAPRTRHYARAKGETVLQLHGAGPWSIVYVNKADDPRRKAGTR